MSLDRCLLLTLFSLPLLLSPSALAQEPSPIVETIDVHVVNVDVVVTDRKGETVRGLTREDFELFEDGKRVEITNFDFVERAQPEDTRNELDATAAAPAEPLPPPRPLHLVVYVDNRNLQPRHRNRLLPAVEGFLTARLAPEDQVMVVSFDNALRVLQPFTLEREPLLAALAPLRKATTSAMLADSEAQRVGSDLGAADDKTGSEAVAQYEMFRVAQREQALGGLSVLNRFVEALAGLSGRKALLYLSGGFGLTDRSRAALDRITKTANSSDVTFYTLDGWGAETSGDDQSVTVGTGAEAFVRDSLSTDRRRTLERLADDTGGFAVSNTSNFERGLERVEQSIASSYSLGFTPAHDRDGKFHEIEVKLEGRGLSAQHRAGYRDKAVAEELSERTLAALNFATALDNPLGIAVQRLAAGGNEWGIAIPLEHLALIPQSGAIHGQVRLLVASLDAKGDMRPLRKITLPIKIPLERVEAGLPPAIGYKLELPGGEMRVVVGAQDLMAGTQSFARVELGSPESAPEG